jgi:hypothetical protein
MPKAAWGSVSKSNFESELDQYDVYEGEMPRKGVYTLWLKALRLKENRNNEPMLNFLLVIDEPKGSKKAEYNGYSFWDQLNVTDQGSKWVNNFLEALAKDAANGKTLRRDFWAEKVMLDKEEPPNILSIGARKLNLDSSHLLLKANCKYEPPKGQYDEKLSVLSFFPYGVSEAERPEAEEADDTDWGDTTDEPDADVDEDLEARAEELDSLKLPDLKKILAADHDFTAVQLRAVKDVDSAVEKILELEFPEGEEAEEDQTEEEPSTDSDESEEDARAGELAEMDLKDLRAIAKELGLKFAEVRKLSEDDLIEKILELEFSDAEPEPEPEPEPTPAPSRARGRRKVTAKDDDEPPF